MDALATGVETGVELVAQPARSGRNLTLALLGYYLAVVAVITIVPFHFVVPERLAWARVATLPDFLANVLMFVPFGFLYRASRPRLHAGEVWRAVGMGALASAVVECIQLFEPARYPTPMDILANAAGAALGAMLCQTALRRVHAPAALIGRLSLQLPLMGLVYLIVPLLWVGSLSVGGSALRLAMLALPVLFGATLVGFVQRFHFGPAGAATAPWMAGAAAAGVLLGAFPALPLAPLAVLGLAGAAGAVVLLHAFRSPGVERRFELPALRSALPFYGTYLVACALAPALEGDPLGTLGGGVTLRTVEILRLLHAAAAFTLLGYALAELRGRLELPYRKAAGRIAGWALAVALATRLAGNATLGDASWRTPEEDALWVALTLGGALYGGWLYHLQRAHVRQLLTPGSGQATGSAPPARGSLLPGIPSH